MPMTVLLLLLLLSCFVCLTMANTALRRLIIGANPEEVTAEWLERFSVANYAPMAQLLANDDFRFVIGQPGFDSKLYRKFRRERLATFRSYLRCMVHDFNRLHMLAKCLIAHSEIDQSALASRLIALRFRFAANVFATELGCLLWFLGCPVNLVVHRMVGVLSQFTSEVQSLSGSQVLVRS